MRHHDAPTGVLRHGSSLGERAGERGREVEPEQASIASVMDPIWLTWQKLQGETAMLLVPALDAFRRRALQAPTSKASVSLLSILCTLRCERMAPS